MDSLIPESDALEFESAARGESHTWRATREFALLGEILGAFEWGALDLLMFDLRPSRGEERLDALAVAAIVAAHVLDVTEQAIGCILHDRREFLRRGAGRGRAADRSAARARTGSPVGWRLPQRGETTVTLNASASARRRSWRATARPPTRQERVGSWKLGVGVV